MGEPINAPYYPDCSTCGHNASGVVAFRCSSFVRYPEGDPRGLAGYCMCPCTEDPVIKAWMERGAEIARQRREARDVATKHGEDSGDGQA